METPVDILVDIWCLIQSAPISIRVEVIMITIRISCITYQLSGELRICFYDRNVSTAFFSSCLIHNWIRDLMPTREYLQGRQPPLFFEYTIIATYIQNISKITLRLNNLPVQHHVLTLGHDVLPHHLDISLLPNNKVCTLDMFIWKILKATELQHTHSHIHINMPVKWLI